MKRIRPYVFAIVALIVLDIVLRSPLYPWFPADFRFPRTSTMGYERYLEYMGSHESARIAVVGDSVIQGIAVERDGTLPAQWDALYAAQDRDVDVFNFGISAAHAEDLYPVVATIANRGAADMIVYYFDYPFYEDSDVEYSGRYPELWDADVVGSYEPHADHPLVDPSRAAEGTRTADEHIGGAAGRLWALYAERDTINAVLFDGTPSSWLKHHVNYQYGRFSYLPQWIKLRPDQFDADNLRAMWKTPRLSEDNIQFTYLRMAVEKSQAAGVPFVLLWGPINKEVVDDYDLVDPQDYIANRTLVRETVENRGGIFIDLAEEFPQELLADSVHPFEAGYGWMAQRVAVELEPQIESLEQALAVGVDAR